jgi:predicted transcriptional regulator
MKNGLMSREHAEEWTKTLELSGEGLVRNYTLAYELKVHESLGLSYSDWASRIGGKIRLSIPDRKEASRELIAAGLSQREAAAVLGVRQSTIGRDLSEPNGSKDDDFSKEEHSESEPNDSAPKTHVEDNAGEQVTESTAPLDPREKAIEAKKKEEQEYRIRTASRFAAAVNLFDPMYKPAEQAAANLFRTITPESYELGLSKQRLQAALEVFKEIVANWK